MIFMFFIFLLISVNAYATVTATIEDPNISEGQIIELRLSSDTQQKGYPSLTELEKDFMITAQSSSASYQMINGKASASYDFIVNLLPKRTGVITIPAIEWNNQKTKPLKVSVQPASDALQTPNKNVMTISGKILEESVYENASFTYQAQVISDTDLIETHFNAPIMADSEVIAIGDIQFGQVEKDGVVYRTLTQEYAIFPKKAGTDQIIQGATFHGVFLKQKYRQRPMLEPFIYGPVTTPAQDVILRAQDLSISVLPKPQSEQNKWWLPAKEVTMTQTFSPSLENLKTGDSITRTIDIKAVGVTGVQLPDMHIQSDNNFKVYAETPKKETFYSPVKGITGRLTQSFVFVPLRAGTIVVPEIQLSWFNTATKQPQVSTLPAQEIIVEGNQDVEKKAVSTAQIEKAQTPATTQSNRYAKENNFLYFIAGLFCSLIVIVLFCGIVWLRPKKAKLPDLYPKK